MERFREWLRGAYWSISARLAHWSGTVDDRFRSPLRRSVAEGKPIQSILIVCTGNICRSAYAEAKLRVLLRESGLEQQISVRSAGTLTTPGKPADPNAVRIAATRGVSLEHHRTTQLEPVLIQASDLILIMEPHHGADAERFSPAAGERTMLLGSVFIPESHEILIPDPYGLADPVFQRCFTRIDLALVKLVKGWLLSGRDDVGAGRSSELPES